MTEGDIEALHVLWPEVERDVGLMLHQAPPSVVRVMVAYPWESVTLREMIDEERARRNDEADHDLDVARDELPGAVGPHP